MAVFHCLHCGQAISVDDKSDRQVFRCPHCSKLIRVDFTQSNVVPPVIVEERPVAMVRRRPRWNPIATGLIAAAIVSAAGVLVAVAVNRNHQSSGGSVSDNAVQTLQSRRPVQRSGGQRTPVSNRPPRQQIQSDQSIQDALSSKANPDTVGLNSMVQKPSDQTPIEQDETRHELDKGDETRPEGDTADPQPIQPSPEQVRKARLADVNRRIESLKNHPAPTARMTAARGLGGFADFAELGVPALREALRVDVSFEVRDTVVKALGMIGDDAAPAIPDLADIVNNTRYDKLRGAAFEAIVAIDASSPEVQSILTRLLVGRSGRTIEYPTHRNSKDPRTVNENRLYAVRKIPELHKAGVDVSWSISLVVDICDVTVEVARYHEFQLVDACADTLMLIARHDIRTLQCFKRQRDLVLVAETSDAQRKYRVKFDSLIKKIEAELPER